MLHGNIKWDMENKELGKHKTPNSHTIRKRGNAKAIAICQ